MLVGSFPMSVDSKARVTLPATFRKEMCEGDSKTIYLVPMKESVEGFTPAGFEAWIDSLFNKEGEGYDSRNRKDVLLRRVALGKLDASKPGTREKYGLTGDVTVIGADDHFEVWNTERWNEQQEAIDDELDELLFG